MDEDSSGFSAKAPVSAWNKRIGVNYPGVFKALLKASLAAATANAPGVISAAIDGFFAFKMEEGKRLPEELAWLLIRRALAHAMAKLAVEALKRHDLEPDDPEGFVAELDAALDGAEITVDDEFVERPAGHPIIETACGPFGKWLQAYGLNDAEARSVTRRLGAYFTLALHREWGKHPADYAILEAELLKAKTPFAEADALQRAWLKNTAYLNRLIQEPVFDEPFGLHEIYVPLRAYFVEETGDEADFHEIRTARQRNITEEVAVDLRRECLSWLKADDHRDHVRLISGDPGSGKTSFAKELAAELADNWPKDLAGPERHVLLVPLHRFNFTGDLQLALRNYLSASGVLPVDYDPLDGTRNSSRFLILFDGLDEISEQGRPGREAMQKFAGQVDIVARTLNQSQPRVFFILGGRQLSIDASRQLFQRPRQVLHALPYWIPAAPFYPVDPDTGPEDLGADLRQLWWQQYGAAKGKPYNGLPQALDRRDLAPITSQPLLNYLLAQSLERGRLDFSAEISLNQIYGDLLGAVYERHWGDPDDAPAARGIGTRRPGHPALTPLTWGDFARLLEEVALLAWHGTGRAVAANAVEKACEELRLKNKLEAFKQGAEAGAVSLLVSFFFRQADRIGGEPAFEFTHRSFGEYLTARRLVRAIETTHNQRERNRRDTEDGWTTTRALERWVQTTGWTAMDSDLLGFLTRQIALQAGESILSWQNTLMELLSDELKRGLPMHKLGLPTFYEMTRQARNAEESLLAALYACALVTQQQSDVKWPSETGFGELVKRLQGQRSGAFNPLAMKCLGWLDASNQAVYFADLYGADLTKANLRNTHLAMANLGAASLEGADLGRARLNTANLSGANLERANFSKASLVDADLVLANVGAANFLEANLAHADLRRVRGLDKAQNLDTVRSWSGAKIEHKWVEYLRLDANTLKLQVVDDSDDDEHDDSDEYVEDVDDD